MSEVGLVMRRRIHVICASYEEEDSCHTTYASYEEDDTCHTTCASY